MAGESIQKKLDRVRPPRVQIKYEVEIGDALELKELPFVVGVLGDYSGKPAEALPPVKDRRFVNIDRDNFNEVLRESELTNCVFGNVGWHLRRFLRPRNPDSCRRL